MRPTRIARPPKKRSVSQPLSIAPTTPEASKEATIQPALPMLRCLASVSIVGPQSSMP